MANEPAAAYGRNSYVDVMLYLHKVGLTPEVKERVGRRLMMESVSLYLTKAFARLDSLASLKDGWDGEGARHVSYKAIDNLKRVLLISDDDDWKNWMIGPDTDGTLGLQSKVTDACISIGSEEFSYYADIAGKEMHDSHVPFSPYVFLETMRQIG